MKSILLFATMLISITAAAQFDGFVPFKQKAFNQEIYVKSQAVGSLFWNNPNYNDLLDFNLDGIITKHDGHLWSGQYFSETWFLDLDHLSTGQYTPFTYDISGDCLSSEIFEEMNGMSLCPVSLQGELTDHTLHLWAYVNSFQTEFHWWWVR